MLQPGNPIVLGVKHLYQDVKNSSYNPFHRGYMTVRLFNSAVADYFAKCADYFVYENFDTVKGLPPDRRVNPGEGRRVWYQTRIQCEKVDVEYGLPRFNADWLVNGVRKLSTGSAEKLLWQAWLPGEESFSLAEGFATLDG